MGHMNCLNHVKKRSRRQREDDALTEDNVVRTVNLWCKALAKANYNVNGHHNIRTERLLQETFDVVDEYIERYGADCAEIALEKDLEGLGINLDIRDRRGGHGKKTER